MPDILILDYGMGNLRSVYNKFIKLGYDCKISNRTKDLRDASKIVVPGVGNFAYAMKKLNELNIIDELGNKAMIEKIPILGICLGAQLFCKSSEEGNCNGLGWINATINRFSVSDTLRFKVPHIGWNHVKIINGNELDTSLEITNPFYFVHSYYIECMDNKNVWMTTDYDGQFISAINNDNIFGVQFHPEKSHDIGLRLLKNFAQL